MMSSKVCPPSIERSQMVTSAIWSLIKYENAQHVKEKEKLKNIRQNIQLELNKLEEKWKIINKNKENIKQLQGQTCCVRKEMKMLRRQLNTLSVETLKATASTTLTDEEKEAIIKDFILVEFQDDLVEILEHQIVSKNNRGKFDKMLAPELKFIVAQLEMDEIENIFKTLVVGVQNKLKKTLMEYVEEAVKSNSEKLKLHTFLLVDLYDYFTPIKFGKTDNNRGKTDNGPEKEEPKQSENMDDEEERIPNKVGTYEQFLGAMDEEMFKSWGIFNKLSEMYAKLSKTDKYILKQKLKRMKEGFSDQSIKVRATLAQLRSGWCILLQSYKARINPAEDDKCPQCKTAVHTVNHLFACPAYPTTLTPESLWADPSGVAAFLKLNEEE
ncbi:hypothetical protein WDU94_002208 [Cyamophila willieti]